MRPLLRGFLSAALLGLAVPGRALEDAVVGEWTVLISPSAFAPRLHGFDSALQYNGFEPLDRLFESVSGTRGDPARGIGRVYWGFGSRIGVGYQFNEDIRAGVLTGVDAVVQRGSLSGLDRQAAISPGSTTFVSSGTWDVSERFALPVGKLGVFLHKVFTFEEEPDLRLFLGGFGELGTLIGARFNATAVRTDIQPIPDSNRHPISADLDGQGWGGGGSLGLELIVASHTSLLAEAGYEYFLIPRVQYTSDAGFSAILQDGLGRDLPLDFSGWYLKLGTIHRFGARR